MDASEEQKDFEYSVKGDGVEGTNDFVKFLYEQYEGSKVSGNACKYSFLAISCSGRDPNCLETKAKCCHLYRKYEKARELMRYFIYQIKELKEEVDISELINDVKFIRNELSVGGFQVAGRYLKSLRKKLSEECGKLGKELLKRKEYVLSS